MPEQTPELAAIVADVNRLWHPEDAPPEPLNEDFGRLVHRYWPAIRAALERQAELEAVVTRMDREVAEHISFGVDEQAEREAMGKCVAELAAALREYVRWAQPIIRGRGETWKMQERAKALLARSAEEVGERED